MPGLLQNRSQMPPLSHASNGARLVFSLGEDLPLRSIALVAEAASAWRPRTPDGRTLEHPAWADLDPAARRAAFEESLTMRILEAALDADGYSTTVRAVAARIAER